MPNLLSASQALTMQLIACWAQYVQKANPILPILCMMSIYTVGWFFISSFGGGALEGVYSLDIQKRKSP
jgi:hypothetical protein